MKRLQHLSMTINVLVILLFSFAFAREWQQSTDGFFTIETASSTDHEHLREVFAILQQAKQDLTRLELPLSNTVTLRIHPNLDSFVTTTQLPWYVAATSNRETSTIHTQRLKILIERNSLTKTLRHELFHLAQPQDWPRWKAEGKAMQFAGELPQAEPFETMSEEELEEILVNPGSREMLQQAVATAYWWVIKKDQ